MDDLQAFHKQLSEAIPVKSESLEKSTVVKLREHLQGFEASVSSMYRFLIDKGLMQSDPYKSERTVTEIQIPSSDPFTEADASSEISVRFSQYVSQWEFLVKIFHISIANLSLRKIKRLMDLLDWIRWTDFSQNSTLQVTRSVSQIVSQVSKMNDPMAGKIINSSASHLRELTLAIRKELKVLSEFLRETYKWKVREEVVSGMTIDAERYARNTGDILNNVKFEITHQARKMGWYKELVQELLEEDFGKDAPALRNAVLEKLKIAEQKKKKTTRKGPDDTMLLMGVAERMARCGEPVRSALIKMSENSRTIQERKRSFGERLSDIFSTLFHRSDSAVVYDITIKDAVTGSVRHESLDYAKFAGIAMKRARTLQELQDPGSATYTNAKAAGPEKLTNYITRFLAEVKGIHRRLEGLEAYFKSNNVAPEIRDTMKTTGLSLKNLKAGISDTLKSFNEYKVGKEEREQLIKLGIDD